MIWFLLLTLYDHAYLFFHDNWFIFFNAVIVQIFNPTTELAIPIETPISKTNAEVEKESLKQKQENFRSNSKPYTLFYADHSLNHYVIFLLKDSFLFHLLF